MTTGDGARSHEAMESRIQQLESRLNRLESIETIKKLQRAYGYYLDYKLWDQIAELFVDEGAAVEIANNGVYRGKERILTFYRDILGGGRSGRPAGQLNNHMQLQGVVDPDPSGKTARGRWREITMIAVRDPEGNPFNMWAEGVYENEYVCEDGIWKFGTLRWLPSFSGRLDDGVFDTTTLMPPLGEPDEPSTFGPAAFVERKLPYHYPHPITEENIDL
ncbi:nuclear transport factor 2 family protein [Nocardia miyunensis]|uniref:nuclear transport factor 2 family protein n=1 Tax=Nocardia miyunensis TaxID=282684 RepID=UPI00083718B8|nr:nuclear transport factor 2 family protein [Nocardia miyunensis]